jgi:hypothetical protein
VSFSGPQPSELRRFDANTGNLEVVANVGIGAGGAPNAAGFHHAFVVDQLGDADSDGVANFGEALIGSSPFDPQSNSTTHLETTGSSKLGGTANLVSSGSAGGVTAVFFGLGLGSGIAVGGISGQLIAIPSPGTVPLPIPNDPTLVGGTLQMQGLSVSAALRFTNTACLSLF